MSMLVPPQAHSNVRDVLAPLFCNGRSFASLIDELSRHFKFESSHGGSAAHDAKVFEASSESQSTDSEAEVYSRMISSVWIVAVGDGPDVFGKTFCL